MNRKVGLMTWFTYDNYGSMLQCSATIKIVKKLGYDIELINYTPKEAYKDVDISVLTNKVIRKLKNITKQKHIINKKISNQKFIEYRDKLPKSEIVNDKSSLFLLNKKYDTFICGSDQIWAPTVFDENYFLSFVNDQNKKIAYAPSIGLPVIENKYVKVKMEKLINEFNFLSTREEQGAKIIKNLTGKDAKVVLDPTLLLNEQDWMEDFVDIPYENYILAYFLGDNLEYYNACKEIAKQENKKLIILPTTSEDLSKVECIFDDLGPNEFISLIHKADMILTDSFHGTIFSINFNKPFISFKRFKDDKLSQNSRIYNILNKLNLNDLIFENNLDNIINIAKSIDYSKVNSSLNNLRNESLDFLKNSLLLTIESKEKNMNKIITNSCTGCGVCSISCPKNCISIALNDKGFFEYSIDQDKCINCGICEKVCGQNMLELDSMANKKMFGGYIRNNEDLMKSSSGGICTAIAKESIKKGQTVIGCVYDNINNIAKFDIFKDLRELVKMQGSKYIQAYTIDALSKLDTLDKGVIIGTPCQISGINSYLTFKGKRDNFLLIDIICHGVPSYALWNKYISNFKNVKELKFRDKSKGWRQKCIYIKANNKTYCKNDTKDYFYRFFEMSNVYNECCYECKYRDKSVADLRVGDYWGPRYIKNKTGVSMIIPMTTKGNECLTLLEKQKIIYLEETDIDDYFKYQQTKNIRIPLEYDEIISELKNPTTTLNQIDKKYNSKSRNIKKLRKYYYKVKRR